MVPFNSATSLQSIGSTYMYLHTTQNTWTVTEGRCSAWAEALVQNPLITRNCETWPMCLRAWLVTPDITRVVVRSGFWAQAQLILYLVVQLSMVYNRKTITLLYASCSLPLLHTLYPSCFHLDLWPSILTSVMYPQFWTPSLTSHIVANMVGTPQLDLWGLPLCQICSLSSLFHVYAIDLRITTVSVCHICLARPCLRVSLYASGLISVRATLRWGHLHTEILSTLRQGWCYVL